MFGTAWNYGGNDGGVAFEVDASGNYSVTYNFCARANCTDGSEPLDLGGLAIDPSGNLYGTAANGGKNKGGTVFKLSGSTLSVLHSFCPKGNCATGGASPRGSLLQDSSGNLFGTTEYGGKHGQGVIFEWTP